jgi:hemin uptake protein HemP
MNTDRRDRALAARPPVHPTGPKARLARTTSGALFRDADILLIEHDGETYTLRQTRQGKLILNK